MEKRYLKYPDLMVAYGVKETLARKIIREIRALYPEGHPLPVGKIFVSDLDLYEEKVKRHGTLNK